MYVLYKGKAVIPSGLLCLKNKIFDCVFWDGPSNALSGLEASNILKLQTDISDCFTIFYRLLMGRIEQKTAP